MNYEQNFSGFYIFNHPKYNGINFLNMGKGDKKTRRGKITMKSYGINRPRSKKKVIVAAALPPVEEKPVVKAPVKETKKPVVKKEAKPKKPVKTEEHPKKKEKEKNKEKE